MPHLLPLRFNSWSSVPICRAPVQPSGWPRAMAPPFGFTFSIGMPNFLTLYVAWLAKASLISKTSMSDRLRPKEKRCNYVHNCKSYIIFAVSESNYVSLAFKLTV